MMLRRLMAALAAMAASLLLPPATAGASGNLGWRLTAWGSADCNQDGAHNVCFRYPAGGGDAAVAFDSWVPDWCYIAWISDGNAAGIPEQILWVSNDPWRSCIPWGGAWGDGTGYYAGIMGAGWPVDAVPQYVFPRDGNYPWAAGTLWIVY